MIFGYARVSTDGQSVDAQVKQLRAAGTAHIIKETASGAKTDRAQLRRALKKIDEGDTLLVTRLDRLARSTRDLLNTLDHFLQERRVAGEHHLVEVCAQCFDHAEDFCPVVPWRHEREGIALLRQIPAAEGRIHPTQLPSAKQSDHNQGRARIRVETAMEDVFETGGDVQLVHARTGPE